MSVSDSRMPNRANLEPTSEQSRPLRPGEWVEVRSFAEIAVTLDDRGELNNLPFMPEMLPYCGQRFEVWKRAHKTCDEAGGGSIRKLADTVHLKNTRCTGAAHGACDAGCLIFWKERWLKRIAPEPESELQEPDTVGSISALESRSASEERMLEIIHRSTRHRRENNKARELFSCQSTEVCRFSEALPWWDLRQYAGDLCTGNLTFAEFMSGLFIGAYNKIQDWLGRPMFGFVSGVNVKTPYAELDLAPGDLVQVKSKNEVISTLDARGRNRGLTFPPVMVPYCGKQYRVLRRVMNVINPRTRELVSMGGRCVILDGVVCTGRIKRFCPRMVYQYWRDVWLTKVPEPESGSVREGRLSENGTAVSLDRATTLASRIATAMSLEPQPEGIPNKGSERF
jgi:hypothetical protein